MSGSSRADGVVRVDGAKTTVYFDGACPLCRREIDFYRRRRGADTIEWVDAAAAKTELVAPDLPRRDALARFHVRQPDGTLVSGGRGFITLWAELPGFRWLAPLTRPAAVQVVLEAAYRVFLKVRPLGQRLAAAFAPPAARKFPRWLERDLRSNHAGETGAVGIYRGVLAVSRCAQVRHLAASHLHSEQRHLASLCKQLPARQRSKLLPMWRAAGFLTGALPALFGPNAVFATIEAVETFVDKHYLEQINKLAEGDGWLRLRETLQSCRHDEICHRDEARQLSLRPHGLALRLWLRAVAAGSAAGVAIARRI